MYVLTQKLHMKKIMFFEVNMWSTYSENMNTLPKTVSVDYTCTTYTLAFNKFCLQVWRAYIDRYIYIYIYIWCICFYNCQILAQSKGLVWKEIHRLGDVQEKLGVTLEDMVAMVKQVLHPQPYTKQEVCQILGVTSQELDNITLSEKSRHCECCILEYHNIVYEITTMRGLWYE